MIRFGVIASVVVVCTVPLWSQSSRADERPTPVLHRIDGMWPRAELIAWDAKGMRFRLGDVDKRDGEASDDQLVIVRPEQIVAWGVWPGLRRSGGVWLIDGSWLCGEIVALEGGDLQVTSDWLEYPQIPLQLVRAIVLTPPYSMENWLRRWRELSASEGDADIVWTSDGQTLQGVLHWPEESITVRTVQLESPSETTELSLTKVDAIAYAPALLGKVPRKRHGVSLALADGSLLHCKQVEFVARLEKLQCTLDCGLTVTSWGAASELVEAIQGVFESWQTARFLSDMEPLDYKYVGSRSLRWELGRDVDASGRPLLVDREGIVLKGLGMHASSRVVYRHDGSPGRLRAELRFAPPASTSQTLGSVAAEVLLAKAGKLVSAARVELRRGDAQRQRLVDVDVTGAQLLVLVVDQLDYEQLGDHVLWLQARIDPDEPANLGGGPGE